MSFAELSKVLVKEENTRLDNCRKNIEGIGKQLGLDNFAVLPGMSFEEGKVFVALVNDDKEAVVEIPLFDVPQVIEHQEWEEFEAAYTDSVGANSFVLSGNDAKNRKLGFVVLKSNGNIWHKIEISVAKATLV